MNKSSVSLVFAFIISALALGGCGKIGGPSDEEIVAQQAVTARAEKAEGEARATKARAEKAEKALEELKKNPQEQTIGLITPAQCAAIHAAAPAPAPRPVARVDKRPQGSLPRATPAPAAATATATATAPAGGIARAEANAFSPAAPDGKLPVVSREPGGCIYASDGNLILKGKTEKVPKGIEVARISDVQLQANFSNLLKAHPEGFSTDAGHRNLCHAWSEAIAPQIQDSKGLRVNNDTQRN